MTEPEVLEAQKNLLRQLVLAVWIAGGTLACGQPLEMRGRPRSSPPGDMTPIPSPSAFPEAPAKTSAEPRPSTEPTADGAPPAPSETAAAIVPSSAQQPASPPLAVVEGDRIRIAKRIVFLARNDTIVLPESAPVLDAVADLLRSNPTLRVEIRVHIDKTDDMGYGRNPSQVRAKHVRDYLIQRGIDAYRLTTKGYGATQPLNLSKTPQERTQNRRTEFVLLPVP